FLGGNMSHSGDIVFVNYGLADDYQGKNVQGKIVVFKSGSETARSPQEMFNLLGEKREIAQQNGAKGAIEMVDINPMIWGFVEHAFGEDRMTLAGDEEEDDGNFGYLWVLDPENTIAKELEGKRNNKAEFTVSGIEKNQIFCRNVVAMIEGTDPKLKDE